MTTPFDPTFQPHRQFLATEISVLLSSLGFQPINLPRTNELVFAKQSTRLPGVQMLVYTSIQRGEVRSSGRDSIKVCSTYTSSNGSIRGIGSERRVHRTGDIKEIAPRIKDRIKDAASHLNGLPTCKDCGAPTFKSKKGNQVCGEICWAK